MSVSELIKNLEDASVDLRTRMAQYLSFARGEGAVHDHLLVQLGSMLLERNKNSAQLPGQDSMIRQIDYIIRQRKAKLDRR